MYKKIIFTFFLCFNVAYACTNISVKAEDGSVIIARTMEFGPSLESEIVTSPKGKKFTNTAPNGQPSLSWTGKHGYIYLNFFHKDHTVDGMNDKGLSLGLLYLPGYTDYPQITEDNLKNSIPYYQLGDWVLSQFESIDEVKSALKGLTVFSQGMEVPGQGNVVFPLHAVINDAKGKSLVIEFNQGKMQVYENHLGILTNAPTFDWHINNLKNYINLTPYAVEPVQVDGITYSATGQGAGMFGLPGDTTPPSRFVKMAFVQQSALPVENAEKAVVLADHIIGTVFIPNGMVREAKGQSGTEVTQWTVIKDLAHNKLYFKSYDYPTLQVVNLNKLNLNENAPVLRVPVTHAIELAIDSTAALKKAADESDGLLRLHR